MPKITGFTVRPVTVPLVIPHKTASGTLEVAPLVLLDIETDADVTGIAYAFTYTPIALKPLAGLLKNIETLAVGMSLAPRDVKAALEARFRLLGVQGMVAMALSTIDMALWDATAKIAGQPLATHLGAAPRPIPVYDSLGQMSPDETARQVEASLNAGFRAFKVKAGHPDPGVDAAVIRAMRKVAGADAWAAMDFNQAFAPVEAIQRMRILDAAQPDWLEEPVMFHDHAGHAEVRAAVQTPIQTGENWWGIADMCASIAAGASDLVMPDAMKIGGVSGFIDAAALATVHNLPMSSHLFAEVSVHLLAATPTAHKLEWMDVAGPVLAESPKIADGMIHPLPGPGNGMIWDETAIGRFAG